ncbi:MAG TPA: hypothetical protein VFE98_01995 [Candidatus Bathyarchaeia archaeon]|nr:hypothetical protein [Candidatus Bathyarchaeia archaeon]
MSSEAPVDTVDVKSEPIALQALNPGAVIPPARDQCACPTESRYRFTATDRALLYKIQNGHCIYCGKLVRDNDWVGAHLCNVNSCRNTNHWAGSHNKCNVSISNQARGVKKRYAKASVRVPSQGEEDSLSKNRRCEPAWVEWVTRELSELEGYARQEEITNQSALEIGLSVYTIKNRYWPKYSCGSGPFRVYRPEGSTEFLVELRKRPHQ